MAAQRIVPLGALGIQAVANRAIHKLSQAGRLGLYAKHTRGPGFARAIANVITELRLEQLEPDALAHVAPDLRPVLQAYEQELVAHGFTDWPGVLRLAASIAADQGCKHRLLGLPTLLLDVPLTTASDIGLARALCSRSPEMFVTAPANDAVTLARLRCGLGAAKKYLLSLRPRLFTSRREKTSQGLSTRKHRGNQQQHPARRSHRLPERHRPPTNRLVLPCRCPRLLKHLRPSIEDRVRRASSVRPATSRKATP